MNQSVNFVTGAAVGALAMYFLDPEQGRRRRNMLTDKFVSLERAKAEALEATLRDARNRLIGMYHEMADRFSPNDVSDDALVARVRAQLGRCVTHPGAVDVEVENGRVVLSGQILAREVEDLVNCIRSIQGVEGVTNQLGVHSDADGIPSLQGEGRLPRTPGVAELRPGAALAVGLAGAGLAAYAATRRDAAGGAIGAVGAALALKGLKDMRGTRKYAEQREAA
jgi:hypothetical protein